MENVIEHSCLCRVKIHYSVWTDHLGKMLDVSLLLLCAPDSLLIIVTGSKKKTRCVLIRCFTGSHSILKVCKRAVRAGGWQRSLICLGEGSSGIFSWFFLFALLSAEPKQACLQVQQAGDVLEGVMVAH